MRRPLPLLLLNVIIPFSAIRFSCAKKTFHNRLTALLIIVGLLQVLKTQAQTLQFTGTPGTSAVENVAYTGSVQATISNNDPLTYTAPVLPAWLSLSSSGMTSGTKINNTAITNPAGVARDADGNYYVVQNIGTSIYKVLPDGTTSVWATRPSGANYGAIVVDNYLYVSFYGGSSGILKYDLTQENPTGVSVATGNGFLSMTYKDGYLYAARYSQGKVVRIRLSDNQLTDYVTGVSGCFGLGFDLSGNLLIALHSPRKVVKYNPVSQTTADAITGLPTLLTDVKIDGQGYVYVSMWGGKIRKYTPDYSSYIEVTSTSFVCLGMTMTPTGTLIYGDSDGGNVYSLQTGVVISGTPAHSDVGTHPVKITVTNGSISEDLEFVITVTDPNAPVINSYNPAVNATEVPLATSSISATFNETIVKATGSIYIKNKTTDDVLETIDVTSSDVTIADNVVTVALQNSFPSLTDIYVSVDAGAFKDVNNNNFAGISSSSAWYFKTIEQTQQAQTITFASSRTATYGAADVDPGASSTSGLAISYTSSDPTVAAIVSGKIQVKKTGVVTITANQAGDDDYLPATAVEQELTISPKEITVNLNATPEITKVYDGNNDIQLAAGNYQLVGVVDGDEVNVSGTAVYNDANAGTGKTITVNNFSLQGDDKNNYSLTTASATVTGKITAAALSITAENKTKVYGAADPALTYTIQGLLSGDQITGQLSRETGSNVGAHAIVQGSLTAGNNYAIQYSGANLQITPASLMVTAEDKSKVYGKTDPAFTYQVEGLVQGDQLSGKLQREAGKNVGTYSIGQGSLSGGTNYTMQFTGATLTITKAALLIKVENKSRKEYEQNPAFTFSYTGFAENDNAADLTMQPQAQTVAVVSSPAGKYDITVTGASSPNYTISYANGELTVLHIEKKSVKAWSNGSQLHISIFSEVSQKVALTLFTLTGQAIQTQRETLRPGVNTFTMSVGSLVSNIYILNANADKFKDSQRVKIK